MQSFDSSTLRSLSTFRGGAHSDISSITSLSDFVPLSGGSLTQNKMFIVYVACVIALVVLDPRISQVQPTSKNLLDLIQNDRKVQIALVLAASFVVCKEGQCAFKIGSIGLNVQGSLLAALVMLLCCSCDKDGKVEEICGVTKKHQIWLAAAVGALL